MADGAAVNSAWDCIKQTLAFCCARARYFVDLKDDIKDLDIKIRQLNDMQEHVEARVRREMRPDMQQVYKVTFWLDGVNQLKEDVDKIRREAEEEDRDKNLRFFCPKNCCYFDRVGNRVKKKLQEVAKLIEEGNFEQVVETKPRDLVVEMKMEKTVGLKSTFDLVRGYMEDTRTGVIGLCGMGGVGKTTLLKMINNSIYKAHKKVSRGKMGHSSKNDVRSFHLVIWVDVSKEGSLGNIQEAIFRKLEFPEEKWKDKSEPERAEEVWRLLRDYKFALLLDDLWDQTDDNDRLDLSRVGVPADCNDKGSKVVFTTRYENTCRVMRADRTIRVECLPSNGALELFRYCVGEATLNAHHEIPQLAERVVEACFGLPLALVIMGRAMSGKINPQQWNDIIRILSTDLPRSPEMEDRVFPVLRISYENLNSDIMRTCFLYFSVLLEVQSLTKEELIELWIAEGLLADHNAMHHSWEEGEQQLAEKKKMGEDIIQGLKGACLLESGKSTNSITMHDITRAMTLWLARAEGKTENKVVVQKGEIDFAKWNDAERLSIWGPGIDSVSQTPSCQRLTTLMARATKLKTLPRELFPSMPVLRVLNLSDNEDLAEVPEAIGQLKNLLYLNLSGTSIKVLPLEFQNLTCLEVLLLDNTGYLETIPSEVIRGLLSLQVFSRTLERHLRVYNVMWSEGGIIDGLEILEHVYEIRITLSSADSIQRLLNSPKLRRCIKLLHLMVGRDDTGRKLSLEGMEHLNRLEVQDCYSIKEIQIVEEELQVGISANTARKFVGQECFINLSRVDIEGCAVKNMSWLAYATKLQNLRLSRCPEMVEVVGDAVKDIFSNLTHLTLTELLKLERISNCTLPFPCLRKLHVYECPNLRVLPFDCAQNLEEIRGERTWWRRLKWTSKAVELDFSPKFRPVVKRMVLKYEDQRRIKRAVKLLKYMSGLKSVSVDSRDQKVVVTGYFDAATVVMKLRKARFPTELLSVGIS